MALQALLPVLLVRHLLPVEFADYRLAWLIAGTAASLLPFAVPEVLSLLLPTRPNADRAAHVRLTFCALTAAGAMAGLATAVGLRMSSGDEGLRAGVLACALFVGFWVPGVILDHLPVADERGDWQARAVIALAVLRTVLTGAAVLAWGSLEPVLWALAATAALRFLAVARYGQRRHRWLQARTTRDHWRAHFALALPIGATGALFTLRRQAEQWIAASAFSATQFAAFSLAAVASPLVLLVRRALSSTLLPAMARRHAQGDWAQVLTINHRANSAVACVAWPALAFLVCFGEPLYDLVYTHAYRDAVPVMRLMAVGWAVQVVELNSLVQFAGLMPRAARLGVALLLLSLSGAAAGGLLFGLPGVALGSALAIVTERALFAAMLAKALHMSPAAVQPWSRLAALAATCLLIGVAGRFAFEQLPASLPAWTRMLALGPVMLAPYVAIVRLAGWWPRRLVDEPPSRA